MEELKLRLLLPSLALIVVATMIPAGLRHPSLHSISWSFNAIDFVNNILLYLPLGIAIGGVSLRRAFLCGFSLSTAAELLQIGYIDRIPSVMDVLSNTAGAVLGYLAARAILRATGYDPRSLPVPRPVAAIAIVVAILGAVGMVYRAPFADFSNWTKTARLTVGPWDGSVSHLQIYSFPLAAAQIRDLRCASTAPPGGLLPASDRSIYDALVRTSQLTLLVCINSHDLDSYRMERIVTYGVSRTERNFTLTQNGDTLHFLLRTPASGPTGRGSAADSGPVLTANHDVLVAAVYDGRVSRLFVEGQFAAQTDLAARRPHLPVRVLSWLPQPLPIREIELGGAEALLSGLLSAGILGCFGVPGRLWLRMITGLAAGAIIGGIIWIVGVSAPHLGLRILLESIIAGLTIAASVEADPKNTSQTPGFAPRVNFANKAQ